MPGKLSARKNSAENILGARGKTQKKPTGFFILSIQLLSKKGFLVYEEKFCSCIHVRV